MTAPIIDHDIRTIRPRPPEAGGWLRRLSPFLLAHRRHVVIAFGASLVGMVITAFTPIIQKWIVDDAILTNRRPVGPLVLMLLGAGVARFFLAALRRWFGGRVALDVQYDLRNTIFDQLQRLDFARHDELQTGQLVSRASSDVALVQGLLALLPITLGNLLMFAVSLVIMATLSWQLTLVALAIIPGVLLVAHRMRTGVFPATWDAQQRAGEVAGVVDEAVTGVRVVKGFGQEARELDRLVGSAGDLYASRVRSIQISSRFLAALQALPVFGQVAVLGLGGWLTIDGQITLGTFLAFSAYLAQLVAPVRMLAFLFTVGQQARAGSERILELLDSVPVVREKPDAEELPPAHGEVTFDDVSFGYMRSEPVLDGFTLTVAPGETVALVGTSGSGKSTGALLLPRFYDVQRGRVTIDGIDIRDVTLSSLRRQIGMVFEESFLFSDTIRSNIAYGRPNVDHADIEAAARAAGAHEFVTILPNGYDTVVGERGLSLSGGQRQRIALARALLTNPRILILDDATSAVDARVEEEIHATLRELLPGRTTLLIAHRRSTLQLADRIVVVDRGAVADAGTHAELLARCPLYRELLAGPGSDAEGAGTGDVALEEARASTVTASAWSTDGTGARGATPSASVTTARPAGSAGFAGGTRYGGGGGGPMADALFDSPLTDELQRSLEALPPADDDPGVDVVDAARPDPGFRLPRFLKPWQAPLLIGLSLVVIDAAATLAGPRLVQRGVDAGVTEGSRGALLVATALFGIVALIDWLDVWGMLRHTGRTAERVLYALRIRIFSQLQRLSLDFYEKEMAGRIMTRMTSDIEALSNLLSQGLITALVSVLTFFGVAAAMLLTQPALAGVTLLVMIPLVLATLWFRAGSEAAYDRARDRIAAVNANLQENLSGVRVTQAFVREDTNRMRFREVAGEHLDARLDAQRLQSVYFPFVELLSVVATALVLGVGDHLVVSGALTAGGLIAFQLYVAQLFAPIQQLSQVFDMWQQAGSALDKIGELMAIPTGTPVADAPEPVGRLRGEVRLDDVTFRYEGALDDALRDVNLTVHPGETVALVGETGAGKSTIVKLVARFYDPTSGAVRIDGHDLRDIDPTDFRHQLGYVPQEAFLFTGSIRDNIAYGRADATDAEIEGAARAVGAHDMVEHLPGGYHFTVTERGRSLSAGQRQLIALARARLVNPVVLLLDEATSNLDLGTEARVSRAMGVVTEGRTAILIAHRLDTARRADRIIVLDDGRVVEDGTHDDLVAANGTYARLWRSYAMEDTAA
jgi:ATP-binding cassette, subfamily B, bacterial